MIVPPVSSGGGSMSIGGTIGGSPTDGYTLVIGTGGVLAQTGTMVTSATGEPLSLKSSANGAGTYTATKSGIYLRDAANAELLRIVASDPNADSDFNAANIYIGCRAGQAQPSDNTSAGYWNVGLGHEALKSITTGFSNQAVGLYALKLVTTGSSNIGNGSNAVKAVTTGNGNVGIGDLALGAVAGAATGNTAAGYSAGSRITSGNNNSFYGYQAGKSASTATSLTNSSALGANVDVSASNRVVIGNGSVTDVYFGSESGLANLHAANLGGMAIGGTITGSPTTGSLLFVGASGVLAQDNTNLFWDDTNNRLGIKSGTPACTLEVGDYVRITGQANPPATGHGLEFNYDNSNGFGIIRSYNRGTSQYLETRLEGSLIRYMPAGVTQVLIETAQTTVSNALVLAQLADSGTANGSIWWSTDTPNALKCRTPAGTLKTITLT